MPANFRDRALGPSRLRLSAQFLSPQLLLPLLLLALLPLLGLACASPPAVAPSALVAVAEQSGFALQAPDDPTGLKEYGERMSKEALEALANGADR